MDTYSAASGLKDRIRHFNNSCKGFLPIPVATAENTKNLLEQVQKNTRRFSMCMLVAEGIHTGVSAYFDYHVINAGRVS